MRLFGAPESPPPARATQLGLNLSPAVLGNPRPPATAPPPEAFRDAPLRHFGTYAVAAQGDASELHTSIGFQAAERDVPIDGGDTDELNDLRSLQERIRMATALLNDGDGMSSPAAKQRQAAAAAAPTASTSPQPQPQEQDNRQGERQVALASTAVGDGMPQASAALVDGVYTHGDALSAVHDYNPPMQATEQGVLAFKQGDSFTALVSHTGGEGWVYVETASRHLRGYVPPKFICHARLDPARQANSSSVLLGVPPLSSMRAPLREARDVEETKRAALDARLQVELENAQALNVRMADDIRTVMLERTALQAASTAASNAAAAASTAASSQIVAAKADADRANAALAALTANMQTREAALVAKERALAEREAAIAEEERRLRVAKHELDAAGEAVSARVRDLDEAAIETEFLLHRHSVPTRKSVHNRRFHWRDEQTGAGQQRHTSPWPTQASASQSTPSMPSMPSAPVNRAPTQRRGRAPARAVRERAAALVGQSPLAMALQRERMRAAAPDAAQAARAATQKATQKASSRRLCGGRVVEGGGRGGAMESVDILNLARSTGQRRGTRSRSGRGGGASLKKEPFAATPPSGATKLQASTPLPPPPLLPSAAAAAAAKQAPQQRRGVYRIAPPPASFGK
tara:strand:- start:4449 stop:6362 length:1914 start_codon:yes stop_codon:yes gene_type:complete